MRMGKTGIFEIEVLDEKGYGIIKYGDRVIRVAYTLPGEKVKIRIPKSKKKPTIPLNIIEESEDRTIPLCPYFSICGGCQWQHIKYDKQLEFKQRKVINQFGRLKGDIEIRNIIKAEKIWRYRNKMEFAFGKGKFGVVLGLKMIGRFDRVVDLNTCLVQKEEGDEILKMVKNFARRSELEPYDNVKHEGFLRFLVVRMGHNTSETMANIVTTSERVLKIEKLKEEMNITSLIWSVSDALADVAVGEIKKVLGKEFITEKLMDKIFKIYPYSFFQTNPRQAEKIFQLMKQYTEEGKIAIDLYTGVGVIAILMADKFDKIIGIEINEEAVKAAEENARMNNIDNAEFIAGKVEDILPQMNLDHVDTLYVDPPRAGMHRKAIEAVNKLMPNTIIYLSCNPKTQARDVAMIRKAGYVIEVIQPIDFFPHTAHVENLVVLKKKKN